LQIDRYEILKPLGAGGMSEVFLARMRAEAGVERFVAIKRLLPQRLGNQTAQDMFIDEARISAQLRHSNIAQTLEFGKDGGYYFIVMEYVHGISLYKIAEHRGSLEVPHSMGAFVTARLCEALQYAHTLSDVHGRPLNIVHRDLNPGNVMLTHHGEVKLIDFGIARASRRIHETQVGAIKGAIGYMSPEQVNQASIDHRSDIFVAGTLLFEMLVGRNPFRATVTADTLRRVCDGIIEPAGWNRQMDPDLARICARSLQRHPDERYQSAGEMQEDLDQYCHGQRYGSRTLATWMGSTFPELGPGLMQLKSVPRIKLEDLPPPGGTQAESDVALSPLGATRSDDGLAPSNGKPARSPGDQTRRVSRDQAAYAETILAADLQDDEFDEDASTPFEDASTPLNDGLDTVSLRRPPGDALADLLEPPIEQAPAGAPAGELDPQVGHATVPPLEQQRTRFRRRSTPGGVPVVLEGQQTVARTRPRILDRLEDTLEREATRERALSPPVGVTPMPAGPRAVPPPSRATPIPTDATRRRHSRRLATYLGLSGASIAVAATIVVVIGFGETAPPLDAGLPRPTPLDLGLAAVEPDGAPVVADPVPAHALTPDAALTVGQHHAAPVVDAAPLPRLPVGTARTTVRVKRRSKRPIKTKRRSTTDRRHKPAEPDPPAAKTTAATKTKPATKATKKALGDKGAEW